MLGQVEPKCVLLLKVFFHVAGAGVGVGGGRSEPGGAGVARGWRARTTEEATHNRFMLSYCILLKFISCCGFCETVLIPQA